MTMDPRKQAGNNLARSRAAAMRQWAEARRREDAAERAHREREMTAALRRIATDTTTHLQRIAMEGDVGGVDIIRLHPRSREARRARRARAKRRQAREAISRVREVDNQEVRQRAGFEALRASARRRGRRKGK